MPLVQPIQPAQGYQTNAGGTSIVNSTSVVQPPKGNSSLIKTIVIIVLSLVSVAFVGLFIWMFMQYSEVKEDIDGQIDVAVREAVDKKAMEMEAEFAEREKEPYRDFAGPADYGQLSFKYPKTWSVYVAADAANGGNYEAYFNPIEVYAVSKDTINALRLTIRNKSFEEVAAEYQKVMERNGSNLTVESVEINGITMNRYRGTIPNTDLNGVIVIFKIRDKTAVMQTDSESFVEDFNKLLQTVTFNA